MGKLYHIRQTDRSQWDQATPHQFVYYQESGEWTSDVNLAASLTTEQCGQIMAKLSIPSDGLEVVETFESLHRIDV